LQAIPAQCADVFFNYSTANRLYVDLEFAKKDSTDKINRLTLCNKDRSLLENQVSLLGTKTTGLQADKEAYRQESDRFQALYVTADKARVEAIYNAPSRLRWFAAGFVAALVTGIAAAFAVK
jgi:hypothetical protein